MAQIEEHSTRYAVLYAFAKDAQNPYCPIYLPTSLDKLFLLTGEIQTYDKCNKTINEYINKYRFGHEVGSFSAYGKIHCKRKEKWVAGYRVRGQVTGIHELTVSRRTSVHVQGTYK